VRAARLIPVGLVAGLALSALTLAARPAHAAPLKVACTGSSSMAGVGSSAGRHIPDELGKALGPDFMVRNFGVAATTAIKALPNAYASTPQMNDALAFNPDVVLFWFGGNDSWVDAWSAHKGEFRADYTSLVRAFQALPSHPKTFLIRLWVFKEGPAQKVVLDKEILPMIDEIALETKSTVIDYRTFIEPHPEWFPDGMHANDTGTAFIGKFFADQVTAALKAAPDGGASDAAATSDATDARGDAPAVTTDVAGADASATGAAGTSGAAGTGSAAGTGGSNTAGTSGAAAPAGAAGSPAPPAMTGSSGCGCSHGGAPRGELSIFLLSTVALLARRKLSRQPPCGPRTRSRPRSPARART
jgi:MYXO-CTERM domain-containing protein